MNNEHRYRLFFEVSGLFSLSLLLFLWGQARHEVIGFESRFYLFALEKIKNIRNFVDDRKRNIRIAVDGGVKTENIRQIANAGADVFVAGSAIFSKPDYAEVITAMRQELN